jgi:hypothetical protein
LWYCWVSQRSLLAAFTVSLSNGYPLCARRLVDHSNRYFEFSMSIDDLYSFEVKRKVENHIRTLSMPSTFIRPPQFMDIWTPTTPFQFKMGRTVAAKHALGPNPNRKHCLVAGQDVGRAAAEAIIRGPEWSVNAGGKVEQGVVRVAGDALTISEIEKIYEEVRAPMSTSIVWRMLIWLSSDQWLSNSLCTRNTSWICKNGRTHSEGNGTGMFSSSTRFVIPRIGLTLLVYSFSARKGTI